MYLVDSSVWIDHLRQTDDQLVDALKQNFVSCHAYVIGEMALGSLKDRQRFLQDLSLLPLINPAKDSEVMAMIDQHSLFSRGIGYIDAHLLAAALIHSKVKIWTHDKRFNTIAHELGIAAYPVN